MAKKREKLRDVKSVDPFVYWFILLFIRPPLFLFFRPRVTNKKIIPLRGPAILVANHVNFFDPIWIYDVLDRPVHFVATEELFRPRFLGFFMRTIGCMPFRRHATDFQSIRNIIQLREAGGLIGIYPEGIRSWDGTNSAIIPTIARIIRRMRVPVFSCRVEGGYLHFPRWADKWRPLRMHLVFDRLYTPDMIPDSEEQVIADIAEAIRIPDYELKIAKKKRRVPGLAGGIQRLLYHCPNCQSLESLEAVKPKTANRVECQSCFAAWEVDLGSRLTAIDDDGEAVGEPQTVAEIYRQIKTIPLKSIRSNLIQLRDGEKLFLVSRPGFLFREKQYPDLRIFGFGRAFLTDRRFTFAGRRRQGRRVALSIPLGEIEAVTVEPGDKLHFIYKGILHRIPIRGESPVKWYDALLELIDRQTSGKTAE